MQVISQDDPRLDYVFQGVRQFHDGQCYREGVFKDGSIAFVDATDSRAFKLTKGTFTDDSIHVVVSDPISGKMYRAGSK